MRSVQCLMCILALAFPTATLGAQSPTRSGPAPSAGSPVTGSWGLDLSDRDPSVRPGDNFYLSQNGGWFTRTQLGPSLPAAAYWRDLRRLAPTRLAAILERLAGDSTLRRGTRQWKLGAFYRAFMDEKAIEAKGLSPLAPELEAIRAAGTPAQLAFLFGRMAGPRTPRGNNPVRGPSIGLSGPFSVAIRQDPTDPLRYAVVLSPAGLGLPGQQEYYSDPALADIRGSYQQYVERMLTLLGWSMPAARAKDIVALETRIARATTNYSSNRSVPVARLIELAPGFDWRSFLRGAQLDQVETVVIGEPATFRAIAGLAAETPIDVWQARQAFALIDEAGGSGSLPEEVFKTFFDFRVRAFTNPQAVTPPRDVLRTTTAASVYLGDAVSAEYVARYAPAETRAAVERIAANLKAALDARLARSSWLSAATRAKAREKLAAMVVKIGAPSRFDDYRSLEITDADLYGDMQRAAAYQWRRQIRLLGRPYDRSEWTLRPEYASYAYLPAANTAEIPAGLLEPPFFDRQADPAVNYGAIGAEIGQMIMAGFDDLGRRYDAKGRLRDLLTGEELAHFASRRKALADLCSAIEPLPGIHLKGDLIVDEALDDIGGMSIALDAYHLSLGGQPAPVLGGFSGDQRFFLGRAQMWRAKFDPAFVRNQIATGVNEPPFVRVNNVVRQLDEWYRAFDVRPGDSLYLAPRDRIRLW